jgi:glycosyltransferase involved in cell wall biosynthesis
MRIVAFAYACEPVKGSEPGAGWVWARMLANIGETWVITRSNNRGPIEDALPHVPERERLHFAYVDLPHWARFWKRGSRGIRFYYILWQFAALREARRLHHQVKFDIAWHLTLANIWLGSLIPLMGAKVFVCGPVGGGVTVPIRLWRALGFRGILHEAGRTIIRQGCRYLNPMARLAWGNAELILVQNPDTQQWLPTKHQERVHIVPHAVLETSLSTTRSHHRVRSGSPKSALYAGLIIPRKGLELAVRTMNLLPDWQLSICGTGWDEPRLRRLARRLGVDDRIRFLGWLPREEARALMQEADVFLFPSLHDDAPFAVVEALEAGLPVVCLDVGGPAYLGGTPVSTGSLQATVEALAQALVAAPQSEVSEPPDMQSRQRQLIDLLKTKGLLDERAARAEVDSPAASGVIDPSG